MAVAGPVAECINPDVLSDEGGETKCFLCHSVEFHGDYQRTFPALEFRLTIATTPNNNSTITLYTTSIIVISSE